MKKCLLIILIVFIVFIGGCDLIPSSADILTWLNEVKEAFNTDLADFACTIFTLIVSVFQLAIDTILPALSAMISVLPEVDLPSISLSDITFMQYAAYIFPIVEIAVLVKGLIAFYLSFFAIKILLRWLKILH